MLRRTRRWRPRSGLRIYAWGPKRTSVELLPPTGAIVVSGEVSDAGRRSLSQRAVPSLRREWRRHVEQAIREARR
ncbi:MAG: hypothetical protein ABSG95_02925 [Solirubrobacteraceae bacterium]